MKNNAVRKWDKENMTALSCRVAKKKAEEFRQACKKLGLVPNALFLEVVNKTIEKAEE